MQDEQHPETDKYAALVRDLSDPCSTETLLVTFIFASSFRFTRVSCPFLGARTCTTSKETCCEARLCCGLLGQGCLRNTDQVIIVLPFVAPTLEIQTTGSFFILNDSLILIQGMGRRLSTCSKIKRSQAALSGMSGQSCEKQQGVELQLAVPFCKQPGRRTQWALMSGCPSAP